MTINNNYNNTGRCGDSQQIKCFEKFQDTIVSPYIECKKENVSLLFSLS